MTILNRYPALLGAIIGAALLPAAQLVVLRGYFSLLPPPIAAIFLSTENTLAAGLQGIPAGIVLGALSGSTLAAWRANDKVRVRRNTRWSFTVALVMIAWTISVPLYAFVSGDTSGGSVYPLLIGPESVPWALRYVFLSLNLNLSLGLSMLLTFIGWRATQKLQA